MKISSRRKDHLIGLTVAAIGSFGMSFLLCSRCSQELDYFLRYSVFSFLIWSSLWLGNSEVNEWLSAKISWIKQPTKRLVYGIVATLVYSVGVVLLLIKLWEWLWNIQIKDYQEIVVSSLVMTSFISLFFHGRAFLMQWKQSAVEAERYQKQSIKAQYESLKNQVNPHFLFNSLNALTNLVYEDQGKAVTFIKQLSEVYRYVLDTREKEIVSLEEEMRFVKSYLYLQEIRFGDNLRISIELPSMNGGVAPLAIQLLIENAIKHNIVSKEQPLTIRVFAQDDYLVVENTLQRKALLTEEGAGMGLENIRKRYEFLSDRPVLVNEDEQVFLVKLPIVRLDS